MTSDSDPVPPTGPLASLRVEVFDGSPTAVEALAGLTAVAFAEDPSLVPAERDRLEAGRGLLAFDGGQAVGSNIVYSLTTSVPGSAGAAGAGDSPATRTMPTAGISWVAVLPTHRRRRIASSLMAQVLRDLHDRGAEPVAALWATEAVIYGRFGFGAATQAARFVLPCRAGVVRPELADDLTPRLVPPAESTAAVEQVAATVRATRPGMLARPASWLPGEVVDDPATRHDAQPLRAVLFSAGPHVRAAAWFAVRPGTEAGVRSEVAVREAYADSPGSSAAMWRWFTELDLVTRVVGERRAVDDPVLDQVVDSRGPDARVRDGLWVRLVDLDRALTGRGWGEDVDAVLEVTDATCPWNAGRWRLTVCGGEAAVVRTTDPADLRLDVSVLGAAYLGSAGLLHRMGRAGRVHVDNPGVLDRLSRSMSSAVQPWAPFVF